VSFDRGLSPLATQIFTMLNSAVVQRDPSAGIAEAEAVADAGDSNVAQTDVASSLKVASAAQAARALATVVDYFSRCEPSNPALIIVQQARDLLGKSFVDVLKVLVPEHVAKAAVNIGREQTFPLPIERLAEVAARIPGGNSNPPDGQGEGRHIEIQTRTEALALLDQIGSYYRLAEPSSPIPFLVERARDLAQRDFLSVLKALLPANTLKDS